MHAYNYSNLPYVFNLYCNRPRQQYNTRFSSNNNFLLPVVKTMRAQLSIKFAGPKAWENVPNDIKEIAYRKPFTKAMKRHILETLKQNNPRSSESSYLKQKRKMNKILKQGMS